MSEFVDSWQRPGHRRPPDYISQLLHEARQTPAICPLGKSQLTPPDWFNVHLYRRGQECFRHNSLALVILHLVGLLQLLHVPSVVSVLNYTGKSDSRWAAFRRYLETVRMLMSWYSGNIFNPDSSAGRRIGVVVSRHNSAFTRSPRPAPTQYDMVLTQWAFCGYCLIGDDRTTGLMLRPDYREGLAHFWRCVGFRLGIPDRLNLCSGDLPTVERKCRWVLHYIMRPLIVELPLPERFIATSYQMLRGVSLIVPPCDDRALRCHALRLSFPPPEPPNGSHLPALPLYSWLLDSMLTRFLTVASRDDLLGQVARAIANWLLRFAVVCCARVPVVPWFSYRLQRHVRRLWLLARDWFCRLSAPPSTVDQNNLWLHRRPPIDALAEWRTQAVKGPALKYRQGLYNSDADED